MINVWVLYGASMLYRADYDFLENQVSYFKRSLFQLVSDFGPDYQANFMISFNDVRNNTNRERLTNVTLNEYQNYLIDHGFHVQFGRDSFLLTTNARMVVTVGNESIQLSNALRMFRDRAALNGDYGNI